MNRILEEPLKGYERKYIYKNEIKVYNVSGGISVSARIDKLVIVIPK